MPFPVIFRPTKADLKVSRKWDGKGRGFFIAVGMSFWMLQLLFLAVMSLLYGSQYKNSTRVHNLNVLAVDYDGGLIGQALSRGYEQLQGNSFPTLHFSPASDYPSIQSIEDIVGDGKYWAAVYTWPGASDNFSAALQGGEAADTFNPKEMISFVWLEARYPTNSVALIQGNLNSLIGASAEAFKRLNGTEALRSLNQSDPAAVQAYLNPIVASSTDLAPEPQGVRSLYNTGTVALSIIQMFFFILAINGLSGAMNLFSRLTIITNILVRQGLAASYTLVAALFEATYIWAFKEDWQAPGRTFALLWMLTWLHMWANFMVIDNAACFVPMGYMPYVVVSYILLNVTSSLVCIPIASHFYRYAYAMPSHNWYELFITITTGGYVNTVYRCLPILFAWFVVGQVAGIPAMTYRCRIAQAATAAAPVVPNTAAQQTASEEKIEDIESDSSDTLSYISTIEDQRTGSIWRLPSLQTLTTLPSAGARSRSHRTSGQNWSQRTSAYYPSIPVGFEGVERILTRD